jgi:hypothetical protein
MRHSLLGLWPHWLGRSGSSGAGCWLVAGWWWRAWPARSAEALPAGRHSWLHAAAGASQAWSRGLAEVQVASAGQAGLAGCRWRVLGGGTGCAAVGAGRRHIMRVHIVACSALGIVASELGGIAIVIMCRRGCWLQLRRLCGGALAVLCMGARGRLLAAVQGRERGGPGARCSRGPGAQLPLAAARSGPQRRVSAARGGSAAHALALGGAAGHHAAEGGAAGGADGSAGHG